MSLYARAVDLAVGRLTGVDDHQRADITSTLRSLADEAPHARWRELGSVAWLSLRLRSRADTDDRATSAWRQGLHRGGTLLVATCAVDAAGPVPTMLFIAATWAAARGRALVTAAFVLPAAVIVTSAATSDEAAPFALRCVVGVAALAVSATPPRDAAALCPWRWMALVGVASAVATTSEPTAAAVVIALTLGVPVVWLLSSRADPRLAVGAAVVLFWRLVAVDLHELGEAVVAVPTGPELDVLLVRWVAMAAGVVGAVVVARAAMRRAAMS